MTSLRIFGGFVAAMAICATARAADEDAPATLKQEIAGVELAPVAIGNTGARVGLGGTLRLGRHRWPGSYWTPIQAGIFAGGDGFDDTILAKLQTEAGVVFHGATGTLELGFGAGLGLLAMTTAPTGCDGPCAVGGTGLMLSPIVRYLINDEATHTLGIFIRAEVPVGSVDGASLFHITGFGLAAFIGFDLAGGWG